MKNLFIICFALLISSTFGQKNSYQTVIGIKGGFPGYGALNVKHNLGGSKFFEASVGGLGRKAYGNGIYLLGDFEINKPLKEGFLWYYGAGAMVGFSSGFYYSYFQLAPNAVAGIEYVFDELPLNLSVETGPYFFISPEINFIWGGAIALRYVVK